MATVADRVCPTCGRGNDDNPTLCPECLTPRPGSGWPTASVVSEDLTTSDVGGRPGPPSAATGQPAIRCPNPSCTAEIPPELDECVYCGMSLGGQTSWVLDVAGHSLPVTPGREVLIGRAETSPVWRVLEPRANISRNHCEVRVHGGLQVRDLDSLNGTFLDDQPVGTAWQDVPEGSRLRLASNLVVRVIRRSGGG